MTVLVEQMTVLGEHGTVYFVGNCGVLRIRSELRSVLDQADVYTHLPYSKPNQSWFPCVQCLLTGQEDLVC